MSTTEKILDDTSISNIKSLAIISGYGSAPSLLAKSCEAMGIDVFIVGFEGQTDPTLVNDRKHMWSHLGAAGAIIRTLRQHGISDLVLIGAIPRPSLLQIKPDMMTAKFIAKVGLSAMGDNDLLGSVRSFLEDEGFRLHGAHKFAMDLLAPKGVMTKVRPSKADLVDIQRGVETSQTLGALDVGQSVIVQGGLVLSVEGIEGTAALIERSVDLKRKGGGGVLVKTCKPQQDEDLDLPTIGVKTVDAIAKAGFSGIAVHAEKSLILDRDAVIVRADDLGVFIIGVEVGDE